MNIFPVGKRSAAPAKKNYAGRGIKLSLTFQPQMRKKDVTELREYVVRHLSTRFSAVDLSLSNEAPSTTQLKIIADQATFRLTHDEIFGYYAALLDECVRYAVQLLSRNGYCVTGVRVEMISRTNPLEQNSELIPLIPSHDLQHLLPAMQGVTLNGSSVQLTGSPEPGDSPPFAADPMDEPAGQEATGETDVWEDERTRHSQETRMRRVSQILSSDQQNPPAIIPSSHDVFSMRMARALHIWRLYDHHDGRLVIETLS